jgi:hypothetical protein
MCFCSTKVGAGISGRLWEQIYDLLKNMHHEQIGYLLVKSVPLSSHAFRPAPHCLRELVRVDAVSQRRKFSGLLRDRLPRLIVEVLAQDLADGIHVCGGPGEILLMDGPLSV